MCVIWDIVFILLKIFYNGRAYFFGNTCYVPTSMQLLAALDLQLGGVCVLGTFDNLYRHF